MTTDKKILVNWASEESISQAEQLKARLENEGYTLIRTERINLLEDILIYAKKQEVLI